MTESTNAGGPSPEPAPAPHLSETSEQTGETLSFIGDAHLAAGVLD